MQTTQLVRRYAQKIRVSPEKCTQHEKGAILPLRTRKASRSDLRLEIDILTSPVQISDRILIVRDG